MCSGDRETSGHVDKGAEENDLRSESQWTRSKENQECR